MPTSAPKISVVMSVYNGAPYLQEAINSVLNQSFTDFEFIIVDDCSMDNSRTILNEYSSLDERIVVIENSDNLGITKSLNKGLDKSTGEFIARMDADDVSLPGRFSAQIDYLFKHPDCVAVGTEVLIIDPDGLPIGMKGQPTEHEKIIEISMNGYGGAIIHPSVMIRHSAISEIRGYNSEFEVAQDLDLFIRLADVGRLSNLPQAYLEYRHHFKQTTNKRRALQASAVRNIVTNAWRDRNLGHPPESLFSVVEVISPEERQTRWVRTAIAQGYYQTARKHSALLLLKKPFSLSLWRLMLQALKRSALNQSNSDQKLSQRFTITDS